MPLEPRESDIETVDTAISSPMLARPHYVVDDEGNKIAVMLTIGAYETLYAAYEELQDIRDSEDVLAAIAAGNEEVIPLDESATHSGH